MTGHANWSGFTSTASEGKWTREDSGKMKYEKGSPQHYDSPDSEAYREGWERIFGKGRTDGPFVGLGGFKCESKGDPCRGCGQTPCAEAKREDPDHGL